MKKEIIYKLLKSTNPDDIRLGMEYACKHLSLKELETSAQTGIDWYKFPVIKETYLYFKLETGGVFFFNSMAYFMFDRNSLHIIEKSSPKYINIDPENTRLK